MGNRIKHIRTFSAFVIIIQIILMIAFVILYFAEVFDLKDLIIPDYIAIGATAIIFFNCLFIWIVNLSISKLRKTTDLKAADVIGGDIQEVYKFASIGLAITDDNNVVIWANDLFASKGIIDKNILELYPSLNELIKNNEKADVKILEGTRTYLAKYLPEAKLWIFRDVQDNEELQNLNQNEAPVVGIISIDNYNEVVHSEDDTNDTGTKVKGVIFDYARDYGVLLRKVKDNQYTMLCNYRTLCKMCDDKFSILDKAKEVSKSSEQRLTLSIGIAHNISDFIRLNGLAAECLNFATSRGGDQVVVNNYGQGYRYFGGTSMASESSSRVEMRTTADAYLRAIECASNVLVMGHTQLDMDALGACLGIKAMCVRQKVPCHIVIDKKSVETKTLQALTSSFTASQIRELTVSPEDAISKIQSFDPADKNEKEETNKVKKTGTLLVVVDVNLPSMTMAPKLLDRVSKIIVIDHHRVQDGCICAPSASDFDVGNQGDYRVIGSTIDPSAASSCELISEFISFSSINPQIVLPPSYATIMLSGIFLDSKYYKSRSTGIKTFEASRILKDYGADNSLADDFLKDDYEEHTAIYKMVSNVEYPSYGVSIVCSESGIYQDADLAKAADLCLSFKGTHASFAIGRVAGGTKISARSDGTISVQVIMEKFKSIGGLGGGHLTAAASLLEKHSPTEAKAILTEYIKDKLDEARSEATRQENIGGK